MTTEEAKQHIEQIRQEKFGFLPDGTKRINTLEHDLRAALKNLAEELNAKETHFILELLQNAEDNTYPSGVEPALSLSVEAADPTSSGSDGCFVLLNNEVGFTSEQVLKLCSVGAQPPKDKALGYIGEKGIGFKSVFRVTDQPHIFSNGYRFRFQKPQRSDDLGYIVPHWVDFEPEKIPSGFTAIYLPLIAGKRVGIAKKLSEILPETILFLSKLHRLQIGPDHFVSRDCATGLVKLSTASDESLYFVQRQLWPRPEGLVEEKRLGISERELTVALPLKTARPCTGRVFAFLPTELETGLPFLANADFLLTSSRDSLLEDRRWNEWLRDTIAPTFVKAFLALLNDPTWRNEAYRSIPIRSEVAAGAEFFAPVVDAVLDNLRTQPCVLSADGERCLPSQVCFAGPLTRQLLADAPSGQHGLRLIDPALEADAYRKRIGQPDGLGVRSITFDQIFAACGDCAWLSNRSLDWWETLFDLLVQRGVSAATIGSFPLLLCQDGVCRPLSAGVFLHPEDQPQATAIPSDWPPVHFLHAELQGRLWQKPQVRDWLNRVGGIQRFSVDAYITGHLLDWMRRQTGEHAAGRLVEATSFVALNLKRPEEHKETLRRRMPWSLADQRVLLPEARWDKELVTPECLEGDTGWNWVFISPQDRQHFRLLSDAYVDGQPDATREAVRKLMCHCGATDLPDPAKLGNGAGRYDWESPRWLRDLRSDQPPQNLERKVAALERWIGRFKPEFFAKFLVFGQEEQFWRGNAANELSELGIALRTKAWLRTTNGFVPPISAFVDDGEIRDFLGDTIPYITAQLPPGIVAKLGVHLRLSANTLLDLLRQMRDSGEAKEELVVRIYRRLQTMEFDAEAFRAEPLVLLSKPTVRWMSCGRTFWKDAGSVFDDEFGYLELTYGNEELHGFFTNKLNVQEEVSALQLAEVWAKMSETESHPADLVEKRLQTILPSLAHALELDSPPEWWLSIRPHLKVWTTAQRFEVAGKAFTPDDTFAEEIFAKTASIAWVPRSHLTARLNRLFRNLGCRSLAQNLRSRVANPTTGSPTDAPRILTQATKELLICWVCTSEGWRTKRSQLEQLLTSKEMEVSELSVEFWLEGVEAPASIQEADALWANGDQRLYLRHDSTQRAQQAAAASSFASRFGRLDKQGKDTVQCLLGLEASDARRELADRKWELTPEQKAWIRNLGVVLEVIEVTDESEKQISREARPTITPQTTSSSTVVASSESPSQIAKTDSKPSPGAQPASQATTGSQSSSATTQTAGQANTKQQAERGTSEQESRSAEDEEESVRALKSADAETEFVHVSAHTRSRPKRKRQQRETADKASRDQHPMAGLTHATKMEIEEAAVQVVLRQFQQVPGLRDFKAHDERKRNHGYDVLAIKQGHALRIEIKAHLREAKSVFVTQKEWHQSRQRNGLAANDRWELWNVENLAADAGKVRITRYSYLPDEARTRESGYWVDLNECASESIR